MEFFRFCLEIIKREAKRFNVGIQTSTATQLTAANVDDFNYDNAHNRCAFLYRCGTINLEFAKDCFSKFFSECNGIDYLLAKWKLDSCLTFCSVSKGPALDYVALLLSGGQCRALASLIGNIKIITKYGAWRNTASIMLEIINEGYFNNLPPSDGNLEVIQGDPFNNFTDKVRLPINESDVVMMIKTLNLQSDGYDQTQISKAIQEFLEALKPGAVLFCIDTKPSINEITQRLATFPGKYLLEPTNMNTRINFEYTDLYKDLLGCLPVASGRGYFLVWEKSAVLTSNMMYELKELSESVKYAVNITDKRSDNVKINESNKEPICKATLSVESSNCDQKLLKHFVSSSTPKKSEENKTANTTLDIGSNDFQLADNIGNFFQNSSYPLQSNSLINRSMSESNLSKKENIRASSNSLKSQLDSISNMCMQAESEFSNETGAAKITELTNKITNLTVELTKLLENNPLHQCLNNNCSRNSEEMCNPDTEVCSCLCKRFSQCSQKLTCQKCICYQSCLHSNHSNSSSTSMGDEVSNYCRPSTSAESNFLPENTSSTAQLVIPLHNLSADVVHQIISLITPSKPEN